MVVIASLFTTAEQDPDFWWHLRIGEWMVQNGRLPSTDIFTFTVPAHAWTDHEYLTEIVMWTVRPGESFWSITTELLVSRLGRPPTDAEIVPVWHQLIELNRSRLRVPTDPGLIFEGQQLVISGA